MIQQYNIYLYWIYSANIRGIYDSWWVSVRPSGAGLGNMFQLNTYTCIGYILPTFGGYMTVGGCLCALRALGSVCDETQNLNETFFATKFFETDSVA